MNDFWAKFSDLLDSQDRKNFIKFLVLIFFGGLLSLLGIGAVIPFINILIDPLHVQQLPILRNFEYKQAVAASVLLLILSFWIKNIVAFVVLKKQSLFLNGLVAKIQKKLFSLYIYSPYVYHVKRSSPELVSNINVEVNMLSYSVVAPFGVFLNEFITSGIIVIALLYINPIFSAFVVGGVLIAARLFMKVFKHKAADYGKLREQSYFKMAQVVIQGLGSIKETKIYQKEFFFTDKLDGYAEGIAESSAFSSVFQQSSRLLLEAVSITVVLVLMLAFTLAGYSGAQMLLLMVIFGVAAVQLLPSMNRLMQALANMRYGYPALEKIYNEMYCYHQFEQTLIDKRVGAQNANPIVFNKNIQLKNIYFDYGDQIILHDVSMIIPKGKRVAFVGHSGAGKTTLVDIILGALTQTQGEMWVDDVQITNHNMAKWHLHFGYIPQMIYIYDCTLRENIAFGVDPADIDDQQVWSCLKMASLDQFVKEQCNSDLNTSVGENGIRLLGGQRQRIGIARALYHNPDILVMDEATAALDNQTEYAVTAALKQAGQGRTIITIAHRLTTIMDYDIIFVMHKGKVVAFGNYQELLHNCLEFKKMVDVGGEYH